MISLRRLAPADASMLASLGSITVLQSHGHSAPAGVMQAYADKSFSEEACRAELLDEANVFYAAFHNNEPAGYFKIVMNAPHRLVPLQPVTKLERLYLLDWFHGLSLGYRLLQQAVALSKAAGEKGMWLDVWKGNEKAIKFYQKQGFETVGEGEFPLTKTRVNPIWVMMLRH